MCEPVILTRGSFAPLEAQLPKGFSIALVGTVGHKTIARNEVAPNGLFEIADDRDIRDELIQRGVERVSLVLEPGGGTFTLLQAPDGRSSWPVNELPLRNVTLLLPESLRGKPPIGAPGQFDTVVGKLTTLAAVSNPLALNARRRGAGAPAKAP